MNCGLKEKKSNIELLVKTSQTGDKEAFNEIVRLYQKRAMQLAVRILGNAREAAEAVQDGFVKAYLSIDKLREIESFETWFFRIIANTAISRRKEVRNRLEKLKRLNNKEVSSPVEIKINHELHEAIQHAMLKLSKKEARAIALFGIEDLPQQQVAEIMNCSVSSVRWHVHRARRKLKVLLKEHLE